MVGWLDAPAKVPVVQTIRHAYSFATGKFWTVLQLTWLPFLLINVVIYFLIPAVIDFNAGFEIRDSATLAHRLPQLLAACVGISFLFVMQFASVFPFALGQKTDVPPVSFPLGKTYWRLVLASAIMVGISVVLVVLLGMVGGVTGGILSASTGAINGFPPDERPLIVARYAKLISTTFMYAGTVAIAARQVFLLAPTIVAEERLGLGRAWNLSRGNFWRLCAVIIAIAIPFAVFCVVEQKFLMPELLFAGTEAAALAEATHAMMRIQQYWYIILPLSGIASIFMAGLVCGAQSFAYRAVSGVEKAEDVF